jgi:hypothetical protein
LEALIEEEKQTQESLKQHALRHSEDSDFEWKFKVCFLHFPQRDELHVQ